jgi:hypothetical protein
VGGSVLEIGTDLLRGADHMVGVEKLRREATESYRKGVRIEL